VLQWVPEIRASCPDTPILLVGLKSDLRDKQDAIDGLKKSGQEPVAVSQAEQLCKELKAYKYLECSSLTQVGMADVFEEAVRCVINPAGARVSLLCVCVCVCRAKCKHIKVASKLTTLITDSPD